VDVTLLKILPWHSPCETEENHKKSHDGQFLGYGLNPGPPEFETVVISRRSRDSSVSKVPDYGLDDLAIGDRSCVEAKGFFL
jgi:hypothetical protein